MASRLPAGLSPVTPDSWKPAYLAYLPPATCRGSVKRVASGVGEGSVAIQFVHQYLGDR